MALTSLVLGLHLATYHTSPAYVDPQGQQQAYQGVNPGMYVVAPNGLTAGFYRNSMNQDSVYAGYSWRIPHRYGDYGLTVGAVSGYGAPSNVVPMVVPSVRLGLVRLALLPKVQRVNQTTAVHLSVEYSF